MVSSPTRTVEARAGAPPPPPPAAAPAKASMGGLFKRIWKSSSGTSPSAAPSAASASQQSKNKSSDSNSSSTVPPSDSKSQASSPSRNDKKDTSQQPSALSLFRTRTPSQAKRTAAGSPVTPLHTTPPPVPELASEALAGSATPTSVFLDAVSSPHSQSSTVPATDPSSSQSNLPISTDKSSSTSGPATPSGAQLAAPAQLLSPAAVVERRATSSRADETPTPTTDRSSKLMSDSQSITTSAATSPALLTPASSTENSNDASSSPKSRDKPKASGRAQLSPPASLSVPQTDRKRRSFLGIKLGPVKSGKPSTSPTDIVPSNTLQQISVPQGADATGGRQGDTPVSGLRRAASSSPAKNGSLPGQGGSPNRQASNATPKSGPRTASRASYHANSASSFPIPIPGSTADSSPGSSQRRRRFKDTRDLSALVSELAAEEAATAAFHQQAALRQPHSFASAGVDLTGSSFASHGLSIPRTSSSAHHHAASVRESAAIPSVVPSLHNASNSSLYLPPQQSHSKGLSAASKNGSASHSPASANAELTSVNARSTTIANGNEQRPPSRELQQKPDQSSASSSASHNAPVSSSLPSSAAPSVRQRPPQQQEGSNWDAASSHSHRSGLSTPSHNVSAASAAFRSRAAALGFSALDAAMTGGHGLVVDPFGLPMHSDSPFDASRAYRSPSVGSGLEATAGMQRSNDSTQSLGYSQVNTGANASTSSFLSVDGASAASSHGGQRVRRSVLTMSMYEPEAERPGTSNSAAGRKREESADSTKAGARSVEKSGSRLSSPFGSRVPSRAVTPKTSSKALNEAMRQEEKLRIKEEKRRLKEEKKQELHIAKRLKQLEQEMKLVPLDPRAPKESKAAASAREAEQEKQRALAKGVDEALKKAQEAQAIALQNQYKRQQERQQQLLQKPDASGSIPSSQYTSSRTSSHNDTVATTDNANGSTADSSKQVLPASAVGASATDARSTADAKAGNGKPDEVSGGSGLPETAADVPTSPKADVVQSSVVRPPRSPGRSASSTSLRNAATAEGKTIVPPLPQSHPEAVK
ncbi:hypothetical protein A4X13_0g6469 [Tilletia indica]|uniref:Uncharacterized protein n=1 Tax=Tilletia indica TaxID=43049 RepID=A0A177T583_9BASI|nr:hypothetical protein A4X13_0g6469 [Tilletia indica]